LIGLLGRSGQKKFFKNQNDVVLVKKKNKSQRVATGFLTRYCRVAGSIYQVSRVTPDFFLLLFFLQSGPVSVLDFAVDLPGLTGF
jgi:hypothetical protein